MSVVAAGDVLIAEAFPTLGALWPYDVTRWYTLDEVDDGLRAARALTRLLTTARARLKPSDFQLPSRSRRRVAGLRREEVAELALISVTWYCKIERGTCAGVSLDTLARIATVLRLSRGERRALFVLSHPQLLDAFLPNERFGYSD